MVHGATAAESGENEQYLELEGAWRVEVDSTTLEADRAPGDGGGGCGYEISDADGTTPNERCRTLDQKATYGAPRSPTQGPCSALATTAAVAGAAYSIPGSEGGSVVVYGATMPESGQNEQCLEAEDGRHSTLDTPVAVCGLLCTEGSPPPVEDEIPTSVAATAAEDVPFMVFV